MQIFGLGQRGFGVVSQQRRDFERYPTIHAASQLVDRPEEVGRLSEVPQRQLEEKFLPRFALLEFLANRSIVIRAVLDGMIEDGRIGCQPGDGQVVDVAQRSVPLFRRARVILSSQRLSKIVEFFGSFHRILSSVCYS